MLQSVHGFSRATNGMWVISIFETGRYSHEYLLVHNAGEKSCYDIHLMGIQIMDGSNSKKETDGSAFHHRCEGEVVIHTVLLS